MGDGETKPASPSSSPPVHCTPPLMEPRPSNTGPVLDNPQLNNSHPVQASITPSEGMPYSRSFCVQVGFYSNPGLDQLWIQITEVFRVCSVKASTMKLPHWQVLKNKYLWDNNLAVYSSCTHLFLSIKTWAGAGAYMDLIFTVTLTDKHKLNMY